jgi:hypothetical protein
MAVGDGVVSPRALDPAFKSGAGRVGASLQGDDEDGCGKDEAVKDRGRRNVYRWGLWQVTRGVRGLGAVDAAGTRPGPGRAFRWSLTATW